MLQALFGQQPDSVLAIGAQSFDRFYLLTLRRLALKHVPESDADDVVQDVCLSLARHFHEQKTIPVMNQRQWLAGVVRHKAIDVLRRRLRHRESRLDDVAGTSSEPSTGEPSPAELLEFQWRSAAVRAAIEDLRGTLDGTSFRILHGHRLEGRLHAELAEELHMTETQVRHQHTHLHQQLKLRMQAYLDDSPEDDR
jgi:RNA polymerase sigma factor (sigma-70 family)